MLGGLKATLNVSNFRVPAAHGPWILREIASGVESSARPARQMSLIFLEVEVVWFFWWR